MYRNNVGEDDMLYYLMTSDFTEGLSPSDLIELLNRFKYFYRLKDCEKRSMIYEIDKLKKEIEDRDIEISKLRNDSNISKSELDNILSKKLTFKERIKGRILK